MPMPSQGPQRVTRLPAADPRRIEPVYGAQCVTVPARGETCRVEAPDRGIARLAARQHGVVTVLQLLAIGLTRKAIRHRVATGRLHPVHRGVYLVGHAVMPPLAAETAAILASGDGTDLSHHSAAALWILRPASPAEVFVTVAGRNPGRRPGVHVHRVRYLDPADRTRRHGLPVTTPARTVLDLAAVSSPREAERAYGEAWTRRLLTDAHLLDAVGRAPRHRGARAVRTILEAQEEPPMTQREAEDRMLALVRQADLHGFETQRPVQGHTVDFLWRDQRVVVEVDGYRYHSDRRRFESDRRRDANLQAHGYAVLRVTWRQLRREPLFVAARLAALLARGEAY